MGKRDWCIASSRRLAAWDFRGWGNMILVALPSFDDNKHTLVIIGFVG